VELFVPRYLNRFRCLGSTCEDTCCREWRIYFDEEHYQALRAAMRSPEERAEVDAGLRLVDGGRDQQRHALVVLREDKHCSFLAPDRLCTLHARYGEAVLGDTCASFPRSLGQIGERVELMATTACPEVARLVLLADDALERVPGGPEHVGRGWITRSADPASRDPYEANFLPVRALVLSLLQARGYPITSRLYFVAHFADQTRATLRRNAARFDGRALGKLADSLRLAKNLDNLHQRYLRAAPGVDRSYGVGVVRELLRLPGNAVIAQLAELVDELEPLFVAHGASLGAPVAVLQRAYAELAPLPEALAARLDAIVERYAQHEVLRGWYVEQPSFAAAFQTLLLRLAAFRFVVGGLARQRALGSAAELDAVAVQVAYLLGRTLDGDAELVRQVVVSLEKSGARLDDALSLLAV
jgi:lysine-N-methylase